MEMEPVKRLTKDVRAAVKGTGSRGLSQQEARFLVDAYYQMQGNRIRADNQVRSMSDSTEPHQVLDWLSAQDRVLETQIKAALDIYSMTNVVGEWSRSICGIGPVIAAGLLAHIDIKQAPTVGHIWSFAGLNPKQTWRRGQKRPWNASLKTLCWKMGESFVKVKSREDGYYGRVYESRKAFEIEQNKSGAYGDQADAMLVAVPKHKQAATYKKRILPDSHIHMRAKRYAVKLFLAHWHEKAFEHEYQRKPPLPYVIEHLGHGHYIAPPE